jgi:hypothetical protein
MKSDTVILHDGIAALNNSLGLVDTEKFISIILREKFDYTQWQRTLWKGKTTGEIHREAQARLQESQGKKEK